VSFSGGHIREELIREKLGLAGLEKINSLAEACASNDTPAALSGIDAILASGVAIEQLIVDLAGYYRSLLLLKNGITRDSLLGYSPDQFSQKALDIYDSIQIEQALDILLNCYRDIRYSVSPRFELETAVSKLSWLNQWVSPPELKAALDKARNILNIPVDSRAKVPDTPRPFTPGGSSPHQATYKRNEKQSLAEEYRRMLAAKASLPKEGNLSDDRSNEDDEEPVWSGLLHKNELQGDLSHGDESQGNLSPVDRVLRIIPGTVVN
jgi:DNA polymerase-3 subunit gamma/tau